MAVTIRKITPIATAPGGTNLLVVKVETSEPELFGLGCATFAYRYKTVANLVTEYLDPLLRGRDVDDIEEIWQLMHQGAYWRNGPIEFNAMSGVDMALWDIKGKACNRPLYSLLGGRYRKAAAVYKHAAGANLGEIEESVSRYVEQGIRHVRVQWQGYGGATNNYGDTPNHAPDGAAPGVYYDPRFYTRRALELLEHIRTTFDPDLEILHDVHERLPLPLAIEFAKRLEPLRLFFLEDLVAPEEPEWLDAVRANCTTPLALGELYSHPMEYNEAITKRRIDFMRMHISCIGGLTPARKAAVLGESFGVRTAWHGPPDLSPVGHMVNLHLDLAVPNFGIQEFCNVHPDVFKVFDGMPELRDGFIYPHDRPGIGVNLDESAARAFPPDDRVTEWTQTRVPDGGLRHP
jgi:mannonate dehydratase